MNFLLGIVVGWILFQYNDAPAWVWILYALSFIMLNITYTKQ